MEKQFSRLRQGNRTVHEYVVEFDRLSSFALTLIAYEQSKIRRFDEGLNDNV